MADQLGKSVGDMYKGAFVPGFVLSGLYFSYVLGCTVFKPQWRRRCRRKHASSASRAARWRHLAAGAGVISSRGAGLRAVRDGPDRALDEKIVVTMLVGIGVAFVLAMVSRVLKLNLLSGMAQKVTFVLIPPLH